MLSPIMVEIKINSTRLYAIMLKRVVNDGSLSSIKNKFILFKSTLKIIWAHRNQIWVDVHVGCMSKIDINQSFQLEILRSVTNATWCKKTLP